MYDVTEDIKYTIRSYHLDKLSEGYNETLLLRTKLTLKKN